MTGGIGQDTPKSHEPQLGEVLAGHYRLESVIGRGGFGIVYKATHLDINRTIALKVLLREWINQDPELAIRFRRESLLASRLRHPNTITLYDHGQCDNGMLYMSMEYVEGRTLSSVLREESPITPARLVPIMRQILSSLSEAHSQGIVHRDLKPSNIMLTPDVDGRTEFVKVLDFGVAKALSSQLLTSPDMAQTLTQAGRFCGTPRYMAPEQFRGGPISPSCDLYALGLIALELLTGKPAIRGRSMVDIIVAQVTEPDLVIPPTVNISNALRQTLNRALRKTPEERYASAEQFGHDLDYWQATSLPDPSERSNVDASTIRMSRSSLPRALSQSGASTALGAFEEEDNASTNLWEPGHFQPFPDLDELDTTTQRGPGRPRKRALEKGSDTLQTDFNLRHASPPDEQLRVRGSNYSAHEQGLALGAARVNIQVGTPTPPHQSEYGAKKGAIL
ncbi:MAG: serine/threonine-protein kinase, partial [Myxococcota bacterium]